MITSNAEAGGSATEGRHRKGVQAGCRPTVGRIFRDRADRSLVVLAMVSDRVLVEYANGEVARVTDRQWDELVCKPAEF